MILSFYNHMTIETTSVIFYDDAEIITKTGKSNSCTYMYAGDFAGDFFSCIVLGLRLRKSQGCDCFRSITYVFCENNFFLVYPCWFC